MVPKTEVLGGQCPLKFHWTKGTMATGATVLPGTIPVIIQNATAELPHAIRAICLAPSTSMQS